MSYMFATLTLESFSETCDSDSISHLGKTNYNFFLFYS